MSDALKTNDVLHDVHDERRKQDAKWGEQNHPYVHLMWGSRHRRHYYDEAESWKQVNARRVDDLTVAWDGILLEEVYEALAETAPEKLRAELVQVAAVAVAWIEAIDRRQS